MQAQKPSNEQLLALAQQAVEKLKAIIDNPKWEKFADKPCVMLKMQNDGRMASRGQAKIAFSAKKTFEFLSKTDTLKKLNSQLKECEQLYHVNEGQFSTGVDRTRYSATWPVSDREFISVYTSCKEGEVYYIASQACNYPYPEDKNVVRAKVNIGGYMIKPIDQNSCFVIYISDVELAGSIPGMVKTQAGKKQGEVASRIEEAMKKE